MFGILMLDSLRSDPEILWCVPCHWRLRHYFWTVIVPHLRPDAVGRTVVKGGTLTGSGFY
jgi:hypothetical protein